MTTPRSYTETEVRVRLTRERPDGTKKTVELGINDDQRLDHIMNAFLSLPKDEMPHPRVFGGDTHLWQAVVRLQEAFAELAKDSEPAKTLF